MTFLDIEPKPEENAGWKESNFKSFELERRLVNLEEGQPVWLGHRDK